MGSEFGSTGRTMSVKDTIALRVQPWQTALNLAMEYPKFRPPHSPIPAVLVTEVINGLEQI